MKKETRMFAFNLFFRSKTADGVTGSTSLSKDHLRAAELWRKMLLHQHFRLQPRVGRPRQPKVRYQSDQQSQERGSHQSL
jgi:hypothetical protein